MLDYTSLENAIIRLGEGLENFKALKADIKLSDMARDSLVQRFEFTFEQAAKLLAKNLREKGYSGISHNLKKTLFREAGKIDYIKEVEQWFHFLEVRNKTSHEYISDFVNTDEYIETVKSFYFRVQELLENMKRGDL